MPESIRTVDFTVTETDISPAVPQWAGVQGEHQATRVRFKLPASLIGKGYHFHVEWIDGMQAFGISEQLTATDDGKVAYLLPAAWTAAGGTAEVRLSAGKDETDEEHGQVFYSAVGRLTFSPRDEDMPSVTDVKNMLYPLLGKAEGFLRGMQNIVSYQVDSLGGYVCIGGKLTIAYGKFGALKGSSPTITLPRPLGSNYYLSVVSDEHEAVEVVSQDYDSFVIKAATNIVDGHWFAVGNTY